MDDTSPLTSTDAPRRIALAPDAVQAALDQEQRLLTEAIILVSGGASPRVTVAGIRFSEEVLDAARPFASARRVRLVPLWTDDERGADIAVEPIGPILR